MRGTRVKSLVFIVLLLAAVWTLWPTYQLYTTLPRRERALRAEQAQIVASPDTASIRSQLIAWDRSWGDFVNERNRTSKKALHMGLDIVGGMHMTLTVSDTVQIARDRVGDALRADMKVIEGRIDKLGVVEPLIQFAGDRLLIQLPGVVDEARAETLIGKTAVLDFRLLADERRIDDAINRIDNFMKVQQGGDTLAANVSSFRSYISMVGGNMSVDEQYYPAVRSMLEQTDSASFMRDYRFFAGPRRGQPAVANFGGCFSCAASLSCPVRTAS